MITREKCKFLIPMEFEEVDLEDTDVFTMEEFIEAVRGHGIMNYDGIEIEVDCYVGWLMKQPKEFTHVCWYNK